MAEIENEVRESTVVGDGTVARKQVVTSHNSATPYAKAQQVIYLILGIIEALLAIRIVLSLLGANQGNGFAQLIYGVTAPMVAPFFGLFGYTFQSGIARFEIETVVAMVVYALVAWVIAKIISIGRTQS